MSWDIYVQNFPPDAATIDDVPKDFVFATIGTRAEIIRTIKDVAPFADFSDPSWGKIDGDKFSIEVSLGNDEELDSFAFHVHGDNEAAAVVSEILIRLKLRRSILAPGSSSIILQLRPACSDGGSFGIG